MHAISDQLPREPGSYLLILVLPVFKEIQVGRLGRLRFEAGWYAYAGSAFGPGGLAARLNRHLRPVQKRHWHIDYLRAEARVTEAWTAVGSPSREHTWASVLAKGPLAGKWVSGFGCSDCRCRSHLLHFVHRPAGGAIGKKLGAGAVRWQLASDSI